MTIYTVNMDKYLINTIKQFVGSSGSGKMFFSRSELVRYALRELLKEHIESAKAFNRRERIKIANEKRLKVELSNNILKVGNKTYTIKER